MTEWLPDDKGLHAQQISLTDAKSAPALVSYRQQTLSQTAAEYQLTRDDDAGILPPSRRGYVPGVTLRPSCGSFLHAGPNSAF